jgi:tetratricopeptide (TPR) repeat protein
VLRRLSVFRGGWTLDAAEGVCAGDGIDGDDVLDLLFRLVDRSLVVPDAESGRFRMLVTIRDYAEARLREAGEADGVRERHLAFYTALAQEHGSVARWGGGGWSRMLVEHDNMRAALGFALERARASGRPEDVEAGFGLANAMVWFWQYNLRYEGVEVLSALLALPAGSASSRALALQSLGMFHVYYPTAASRASTRESLDLFTGLGDTRAAALSRLITAWEGQYDVDIAPSRALAVEAADVLLEDATPGLAGLVTYVIASLDLGAGDFEAAAEGWPLVLEHLRASGDRVMQSAVLAHYALALRETGRPDEALTALRDAVDMVSDGQTLHGLAFALVHLAHTELDLGTHGDVPALLAWADESARRVHNPRCQAWAAWGRARLSFSSGDAATALAECRRAVELLADREFPWARVRLWALLSEVARAAGDAAEAARAEWHVEELAPAAGTGGDAAPADAAASG